MIDRKLARRYAEAIGELAYEKGELDEVEANLGDVLALLQAEPRLKQALADQNIPDEQKDEWIVSLLQNRVGRTALNFVRLVVAKRRGQYLDEMIRAFYTYANEKRGIVEVEVTAAAPLSPEAEDTIVQRLSGILGKKVTLQVKEDAELLGGIIAKVGDLVMDGSVRTRLEALHATLMKARLN